MELTSIRGVLALIGLLSFILIKAFLVLHFVASPMEVAGRSMVPTLVPGDRVWVDRWSYRHRSPRRGEAVMLRDSVGRRLVKRIAEFPRVAASGGNSTPSLWVLGDHPVVSLDSRQFGAVPLSEIEGRVVWRYWPPSTFGPIPEAPPAPPPGR